ncbi:MAG: aminofutalosine synthase MqnE [Selenomonadaceae bacterium]
MTEIETARHKAETGERLTLQDALALYEDNDLLSLAAWARVAKERKSGKRVFYNVNRHINLTNICISGCPLCAFQCEENSPRGYVLETEDIARILDEAKAVKNLGEIHIVSALHPTKPFTYYLNIVKQVKAALPKIDIKAFTPVEIVHFSQITGKSIREVLTILKNAGLSSLPGGGAEILSERVRGIICPKKATAAQWIETMKTAHTLGIRTNATMMYGHIETIEERLQHLITLRDLQDETGGFQAFVSFPFHPAHTGFSELRRAGAWEDMKMMALSRLILDNIDHIKAFWIMLTMPIAQLALGFGADDLDGTIGEEKIIHAAGAETNTGITRGQLRKLIAETGYEPIERDTFYKAKCAVDGSAKEAGSGRRRALKEME